MKKVLVIAPYPYLPYFSGGQKYIAQFLEHLGSQVDLTVISVPENDFSLAKSYKTVGLLKKSFLRYVDRGLVSQIEAIIKEKNIDSLICEHPYFAWLAFSLKKRTGVKVIIHAHNIEYQRFRSTGKWWWPVLKGYEKRSFKNADAVLFISPEDRQFAIQSWKLDTGKCFELPYGIEEHPISPDRLLATQQLRWNMGLTENHKILLFAGLLNYKPNKDALDQIVQKINPLLKETEAFSYRIIICGKSLSPDYNNLESYADKNITFAGFVEDIDGYYRATDIFLNPVLSGGGVKTKIIEAIAAGATVISTETGARGLDKIVCGEKLVIVKDNDWKAFAEAVVKNSKRPVKTPASFYEKYSWKTIIKDLILELPDQLPR